MDKSEMFDDIKTLGTIKGRADVVEYLQKIIDGDEK